DLGGGTHSAAHTNNSGGGTFATNGKNLNTFTAGNSASGSNLTVLAEDITYAAINTIYIDTGAGTLSAFRGVVEYSKNTQGVFVIGSDYVLNPTTTYTASLLSYDKVFVGKEFAAGNVRSTTGVLSAPAGISTVNFTGDIYLNSGGAALSRSFTSITSTGGHVYFVGNMAFTNSSNLIVSAAKGITINSSVSVGANNKLTLTTAQGGVVGSGVITAGTLTTQNDGLNANVTASGVVGGIKLTGANLIGSLGNLTNSGGGNISISNAQATNVAANAAWSNKNGMISVKVTTGDLTLQGAMTIASGTTAVRLDLGSSANIKSNTGTNTITATGVDVYYSGKSTGNGVNFKLGETVAASGNIPATIAGVFTHVADATPKAGSSETIDKAYTV
ncbi:MAG: hypothetical protein ORN98_00540, partial [Alphaproteobacteria bacterium]|nr:hypothetical protein [Alphaproteobacteria bacterium]